MRTNSRTERGAYSVLFALLAIMLMTVAALAVDIGNGVARKSDVQGQADFAALAGGAELGIQSSGTVPVAVVDAVRDFLNSNHPLNQDCSGDCVVSSQLTDGQLPNGEVRFENGGLRVYTPEERVDFGFARVIGWENIDVQGDATVGVFSPGAGALPMYAASGCDYGLQTIADPAQGLVVNDRNLALDGQTNTANLASISSPNPAQISQTASGVAGPMLNLVGTNFYEAPNGNGPNAHAKRVTKIGFFFGDGVTYYTANVDWTAPTNNTASFLTIPAIPAEVASDDGVWWVRVFKETDTTTDGEWSSESSALPLTVGTTTLECDSGASDGNFGTLMLPRTDGATADDAPVNIADSFEEPLTLASHPATSADGLCTAGTDGAIESDDPSPGLLPGTNCVDTDTGMPANVATKGFVTGVSTGTGFVPGRLNAAENPTNPDCNNGGNMTLQLGNGNSNNYTLNNDVLSCFLTDSGTLASILDPAYSGDSRLSDEIYESPRFFWVPVLAVEPTEGGSGTYWITDFRPAFLTDESASSTKTSSDASSSNGLYVTQNQNLVTQIKVVFFNWHALPSRTAGPVGPYLGVGPKVLRMID